MSALKKIDQLIARVRVNGDKFNILVHDTAVMIAMHAEAHGDCSRAKDLALAMPASMRRTMLIEWFNRYTPIRISITNDKVGLLKDGQKGFTPFDIDTGRENPWHKLAEETPEQAPMTYDKLLKLIEGLSKRAEKMIEDGKVAENDIDRVATVARALKAVA